MNPNSLVTVPVITLVGPPNSGKTTLFNAISGQNYKTVNYPGATVEYSISTVLKNYNINAKIIDSPGIISLIPNSQDERVAVDSLFDVPNYGPPDLVITTVDASQLSRHLFLVKQLIESNFRVILALTMTDILHKKGLDISTTILSKNLGCDVVVVDARKKKNIDELIRAIEKNLEHTSAHGKNVPVPYNRISNKQDLLDSYHSIEEIESSVLYLKSDNNQVNLQAANSQLNILTNNQIKANCYQIDETTVKVDKILLHKIWGLLSFFLIMSITFTSIFWFAQPLMNFVDDLFGLLSAEAFNLFGTGWFGDLVANGIINGTGSVLVFVPQIIILFLILGVLEDTGYLARGAMLIDKPLSKIGLNGKSFVPMLSGFACAIPAMLAARTIPNKKERLLTIFILPLLSCSARLPVYALLIAFLIPQDRSWIGGIVLSVIYITSIGSSIVIAAIINKFSKSIIRTEDSSSFILELPAYRKPKLSVVISNTFNSAMLYIKKAGPTILAFSLLLWFLTYFPDTNPKVETEDLTDSEIVQLQNAERLSNSYASELGKIIQPIMSPLGLDWRVGVSLIAAFAAREVFVSSLALIFKVTGDDDTIQQSILKSMRTSVIGKTDQKLFTTATISGLIVFFIFALQCLSTVAVSKKETGSWRIPLLQVFLFTGIAYILAFITVNGMRALGIN